jgi:hypothetical protein
MKLSAKDLKAINWYIAVHNLKLKLSTPPIMYFKKASTGEEVTVDLTGLVLEYNNWKEQDKRLRAR